MSDLIAVVNAFALVVKLAAIAFGVLLLATFPETKGEFSEHARTRYMVFACFLILVGLS